MIRPLHIALFRGRGLLSGLIRWQTDGRYSHAAVVLANGSIIESWQGKGVRWRPRLTDSRDVDLYRVETTHEQALAVIGFLNSQLGRRYDYWGVLRFISRRRLPDNEHWFCSELVFAAFKAAGIELLARTDPPEVHPTLLARSPLLTLVSTADPVLGLHDLAPGPDDPPEKKERPPLTKPAAAPLVLVAAALLLAGCTVNREPCTVNPALFPDPNGPDTTQKFDANGHPNFGPAQPCTVNREPCTVPR